LQSIESTEVGGTKNLSWAEEIYSTLKIEETKATQTAN